MSISRIRNRSLLLLAIAACAWAQQDSGGLVISVRDPNAAVVPGAKVTVINVDTNQTFSGTTIDTGDFTASGIKTTQTRYTLDGTDNTSYNQNLQSGRTFAIIPSMDSIAEFSVQTNAFSAEFGGGGGAAVTVITKGGANQLHGSVFEYRQGSDVNANSFFNNARKLGISPYRYDQYGVAAGGPVYLPNIYNGRNKSFLFFDYERLPRRSPGSLTGVNIATPA